MELNNKFTFDETGYIEAKKYLQEIGVWENASKSGFSVDGYSIVERANNEYKKSNLMEKIEVKFQISFDRMNVNKTHIEKLIEVSKTGKPIPFEMLNEFLSIPNAPIYLSSHPIELSNSIILEFIG